MSWAIWITGPPASGTSAVARGAAALIEAADEPPVVLELDEVRRVLTPAPTQSAAEQELVCRGLVWIAMTLTESGVPVIVDATGDRRAWRDLARASIPRFAEVQLHRSSSVRRKGETPPPGGDVPYDPAPAPELEIDTSVESVEAAAESVAVLARSLRSGLPRASTTTGTPWAIWITGLPGSGKTTLAFGVSRSLTAAGVPVRVLTSHEACHHVLCGSPVAPGADDLFHRTLVYAAKRLTEAGVPVIIDATARCRQWRALARELIPRFAEVQLRCPPEVCAMRERAARWHLPSCRDTGAPGLPGTAEIDLVFDYEAALRPELVVYTDVEDPWTATESVVVLARTLHADARTPVARPATR